MSNPNEIKVVHFQKLANQSIYKQHQQFCLTYGLSKQENLSFDRPTKVTTKKAYEPKKKDVSEL